MYSVRIYVSHDGERHTGNVWSLEFSLCWHSDASPGASRLNMLSVGVTVEMC